MNPLTQEEFEALCSEITDIVSGNIYMNTGKRVREVLLDISDDPEWEHADITIHYKIDITSDTLRTLLGKIRVKKEVK